MQIIHALKKGTALLKAASVPSSELDARLLLQFVLNYSPEQFFLNLEKIVLKQNEQNLYFELIARRENKEPLAKIIGKKPFWLSEFIVNKYTLDPRPDSETIILAAKDLLKDKNHNYKFLDLGTGTGCLILSLLQEFPNSTAIATDISFEAIKVAKQNAINLKLDHRITFLIQNWGDSLNEKFDLIVSNPPYIPTKDIDNLEKDVKNYDPMLALDGGIDGLEHYNYLATQILSLLKPEAYAILEFGYNQSESIKKIYSNERFKIIDILTDLSKIERAIILRTI